MNETKTCEFCKKEFEHTSKRAKKYCSPKCYFDANSKRNTEKAMIKRKKIGHTFNEDKHHNNYQKNLALRIPKKWFKEIIKYENGKEIKKIREETNNELKQIRDGFLQLQRVQRIEFNQLKKNHLQEIELIKKRVWKFRTEFKEFKITTLQKNKGEKQ